MLRILTHAIDPHDIRLILNRPGLEQRLPVVDASHGPVGNHHQQFCPEGRGFAVKFRKPQVIADRGRHLQFPTGDHLHLISRGIHLTLPDHRKGMHFPIAPQARSLRGKDHGLIRSHLSGLAGHPTDHIALTLPGQILKKQFRLTSAVHRAGVHRESNGEHFRQHQQGSRCHAHLGEHCTHSCEISIAVLPGDVCLDTYDFHAVTGRTELLFIEIVESILSLIYIERKNNPALILSGSPRLGAVSLTCTDICALRMAILKSPIFSIMICYNEYLP